MGFRVGLAAAQNRIKLYSGEKIPGLWSKGAGNNIRFSSLFSNRRFSLDDSLPIGGVVKPYIHFPQYLKEVEVDLTGLTPAEVRDIIRTAVRMKRIDSPRLKEPINAAIRHLITCAAREFEYYYNTENSVEGIKGWFRDILDFIKDYQLDAVLIEEIDRLKQSAPTAFSWQQASVQPAQFPSLGIDGVVFSAKSSPLTPEEIGWMFEENKLMQAKLDINSYLSTIRFRGEDYQLEIKRYGLRPWLFEFRIMRVEKYGFTDMERNIATIDLSADAENWATIQG